MINIETISEYNKNDTWGKKLIYHLINHPSISATICKYEIPKIPVYKNRHFIPLIYNNIVFIIDDWDNSIPTQFLLNNPNIPKFYLNNNTCILKIQYCLAEMHNYQTIYNQTGIKVLPFTMFANHTFNLENFKWDSSYDHKFSCIFTGKAWKHRLSWLRFAENKQQEIGCHIDLSNTEGEKNSLENNIAYYNLLKETKWGVVLKGKGCGGKNRREVEFSSLGMPLALNYVPNYPFEFIPDRDFVFLKSQNDLLKLKDIDPKPFAERSSIIYNNYFSPSNGIFNSFKLVYDLFTQQLNTKTIDYSSKYHNQQLIVISANKDYNIGSLENGDIISLQYKSGSWKSWGRSGRGKISPDNTNNRGGDNIRLAIIDKSNFQRRPIQIVPENTKIKPFEFIIDKKYENLCLGIFDTGKYPRGTVEYMIQIIRKH